MTLQLDINKSRLSPEEINALSEMRIRCIRRILLSTTLAASGHPGGSLSALDLLLVTYGLIKHDPRNPRLPGRDRVVVSMGHISPGVYSTLAEYGYFTEDDFLSGFRRAGSGFPGHVESVVPGVEWDTGNLGQGLSAAVGIALAFKIRRRDNRVICLMGDGEHQKGQVAEALRFANKFRLDNLIVLIDRNHLQICGDTEVVMPQSIRDLYAALGWQVTYLADGHDCNSIFIALAEAYRNRNGKPTAIIARTIMGKGISFMENLARYHGSPLKREQLAAALDEIGVVNDIDDWEKKRRDPVRTDTIMAPPADFPEVAPGTPILYGADAAIDNRSAYGNALEDLAVANNIEGQEPKIVGVSCDLEGSVKMGGFRKHCPDSFCEAGIQEHHAAGMSGAMSREGLVTFFSTFGSFAVSEAYNQNRLSDFNHTNLKIVATHVGLDVGEDGPTHQCIDYLGLMKNYFRFSVFMPADPNQTDRIIRYIATRPGNHFVGMGRSKTPVITDENGRVFYDADYTFVPGKADWLRRGTELTMVTFGSLVPAVIEAWRILGEKGVSAGVLNMASLIPLDEESLAEAGAMGPILTVEDHHVASGLGASVAVVLVDRCPGVKMNRLGVGHYGSSGKPEDLYADQGLDPKSIAGAALQLLGR